MSLPGATAVDALRGVVRSPALTRLVVAFGLFIALEFGSWIAILVYAYEATGPESVGIVAVVQLVPAAIAAPWLVRLGERLPASVRLGGSYLIASTLTAAMGAAMIVGVEPVAVYLLAIVTATSVAIPRPLHGTLLPALADDPRTLTAANGATAVAEGIGALVGPLAIGLIIAVAEPGTSLVLASVLTLAAAGLTLVGGRDRASQDPVEARHGQDAEEPEASAGILALFSDPATRVVAAVAAAQYAAVGATDVALVLVAIELLGMGEPGPGYLNAAMGLGGVVGGATTFALAGRSRLGGAMLGAAVVFGATFGAIAFLTQPAAAMLLLIVSGAGLVIVDVSARTLLQRTAPPGSLTVALALVESATMGGLAAGALVVPVLVALFGLVGAIVIAAASLPVMIVAVWIPLSRLERAAAPPLEEIAILQRLPLFAPLPSPALAAVARRVQPFHVPSGTSIIVEGEPGDRWYAVVRGSVRVHRAGETIGTLGPGESFGEIALLRRVPRTASVTSIDDTDLLALDREPFLDAITGSPDAAREADHVAASHLRTDEERHHRDPSLDP